MKKDNPFVLTTTEVGEIKYAKGLDDGNLLVSCTNEEQLESALKLKETAELTVSDGEDGSTKGGECNGIIMKGANGRRCGGAQEES